MQILQLDYLEIKSIDLNRDLIRQSELRKLVVGTVKMLRFTPDSYPRRLLKQVPASRHVGFKDHPVRTTAETNSVLIDKRLLTGLGPLVATWASF